MTTRVLPPAEWPRLAGTELDTVWPVMDPEKTRVVVVEDAGVIIACWAALVTVHVEGLWIAPTHRGKGGAARRLLRGMREAVTSLGASVVFTASTTDEMDTLIERAGGVRLPGDHFALGMGVCQQLSPFR